MKAEEQLRVLSEGIAELISSEQLLKQLSESIKTGKPLRVKAGFDPSAPDIHLGHTVLLNKLRQFQDFGHHVIFIIGDATARIGDPSGRNKMRPMLTDDDVKKNAKTYQKQAFKILDPDKTETVFNNDWFGKMKFADLMGLASRVTLNQILHREDFQKRQESNASISMLELFYPLMQAYDSVYLKSDVELGGTDQKFNLLLGRELQKEWGLAPQSVMLLPLLVGLDGEQKMSKSLNNHVGVQDDPKDMFGKVMSIPDRLLKDYTALLTRQPFAPIERDLNSGALHPRDAKLNLAHAIVSTFCGKVQADQAKDEFIRVFSQKSAPSDMPEFRIPSQGIVITKLLVESGAAPSGNEARRLIQQNAVTLDQETIIDPQKLLTSAQSGAILKVGKRKFFRLTSA